MADYYIDSSATGAADGTTKTDAYTTADAAWTARTASGNTFLFSYLHSYEYGVYKNLYPPALSKNKSIDFADDTSRAGAIEKPMSLSNTLQILCVANSKYSMAGITLEAYKDMKFSGENTLHNYYEGAIKSSGGQADGDISTTLDAVNVICNRTEIAFSNAGGKFYPQRGSFISLLYCPYTGTKVSTFMNGIGLGGGSMYIEGVDLDSWIVPTTGIFLGGYGVNDDIVKAKIRRCKIPAGLNWVDTTLYNHEIDAKEVGTADDYYGEYFEDYKGSYENDTTTYLDATYDGTNGISTLVSTSTLVDPYDYLRVELGSFAGQDLTTAQTISVECTSDASLTDNDIWLEIVRNDTTDEVKGVMVSTANADPEGAGTSLTTAGTGTWTSGDTEDYIISKDLGALTGVDNGTITVYACVGKASIFANFDKPKIAAT